MDLCELILWKLEGNGQEDKERIQDFRMKVLDTPSAKHDYVCKEDIIP
jgi:hypothetical protein